MYSVHVRIKPEAKRLAQHQSQKRAQQTEATVISIPHTGANPNSTTLGPRIQVPGEGRGSGARMPEMPKQLP